MYSQSFSSYTFRITFVYSIFLTLTLSLFNPSALRAQTAEDLKEEFLRTYDPQGYGYYKFGTGIAEQGKQIANSLSRRLSRSQDLINTMDPDALLGDFNQKMQNIESLEASFTSQTSQFGFQQGQQIGDMINSGDTEGAVTGLLGALSAFSKTRKAEKELEARKEALREQRRQKMSQIYWKAIDFNENTQKNYLNRAAFSENPKNEQYNLNFVKNLQCFAKSMEENWSSTHTRWLNNTCPKPVKPTVTAIENKFVAKDVQYGRTAERKFEYYQETGHTEFLQAAISFAAEAAKSNPSAANYYQLGLYYERESTILTLSSILTAKEIDPDFFTGEKKQKLDKINQDALVEIRLALQHNDKKYLEAFLNAGLDKTIKIDGSSLLVYAVKLDQPDAMQLILNKYIDGLSQDQITAKLQKAIMLCAANNSTASLQRFIKLGVNTDFTLNAYSPIDVANKVKAEDAYQLLLDNSSRKNYYTEKYRNSETQFFAIAKEDPVAAASRITSFSEEKRQRIAEQLLEEMLQEPAYAEVIGGSDLAQNHILSVPELYNNVKMQFKQQLEQESPSSKAHLYVKAGLIAKDEVPLLKEIVVDQQPSVDREVNLSIEKKINLLLEDYKKRYSNLEKNPFDLSDNVLTIHKKAATEIIKELTSFTTNINSLDDTQIRFADSEIFLIMLNTVDHPMQKPFYIYLLQQYESTAEIPVRKKLRALMEQQKYLIEKFGYYNGQLIQYEKIEANEDLSMYDSYINRHYNSAAILFNLPMDKKRLNDLIMEDTTEEPKADLLDESIAFAAFAHNNYELFGVLDGIHDLSKVRNVQGELLFQSILNDAPKMLQNSAYFSRDFDFLSKIEGKPAILYFLEKGLEKDGKIEDLKWIDYNAPRSWEEYSLESSNIMKMTGLLISQYELGNFRITSNDGTLYHYAMEKLINDEMTIMQVNHFYKNLEASGVDVHAKNKDGKTVYDLYQKKDKEIRDTWLSRYRDLTKKQGLRVPKSVTRSEFKEHEEILLGYISR